MTPHSPAHRMANTPSTPEQDPMAVLSNSLPMDGSGYTPTDAGRALAAIDRMIEERDALRAAARELIASAPRKMCPRNAREREAYKAFRIALEKFGGAA